LLHRSISSVWDYSSNNNNQHQHPQEHQASDFAIDAYAEQVLEEYAAAAADTNTNNSGVPVTMIDDSLGAYVTSCLRKAQSCADVTKMNDVDALCELLQEHCAISTRTARQTLQKCRKFDGIPSGSFHRQQ
jgi:hypothetical protein